MNSILNFSFSSKGILHVTEKVFPGVMFLLACVRLQAQSETSYQPQPFLEGNPIWVYKYEHIPRQYNQKTRMGYWLDTGDRYFTYYFLGGQKEIDGKAYSMMAGVQSKGNEDLVVSHWLPVREKNGIVYALTDSLPGFVNEEYDNRYNDEWQPMPYLQQGNECVLYNFSTEVGEKLFPQDTYSTVVSFGTYQLIDGTACRVLETEWGIVDLYERLGYLNLGQFFGTMDPLLDIPLPTNGHVYVCYLNAYFQDGKMLYKAPDAREGLCVNDTIWTRDDANEYARSYKADHRQEEVFSYIRRVQAEGGTGLSEINNEKLTIKNDSGIFDLSGRKVAAEALLQRGSGKGARIYIRDGRKMLSR